MTSGLAALGRVQELHHERAGDERVEVELEAVEARPEPSGEAGLFLLGREFAEAGGFAGRGGHRRREHGWAGARQVGRGRSRQMAVPAENLIPESKTRGRNAMLPASKMSFSCRISRRKRSLPTVEDGLCAGAARVRAGGKTVFAVPVEERLRGEGGGEPEEGAAGRRAAGGGRVSDAAW